MPKKFDLPQSTHDYKGYVALIQSLLSEGKVTGYTQSEALVEYSNLNLHRMHRWEKTWSPDEELMNAVKKINAPQTWVIVTEGWCGDAAQQIPVFEHLAALNSCIATRYVLRDENPEFMNHFLTNGARSIPVVLCFDSSNNLIWKWGPRPVEASQMLATLKQQGIDEHELKKGLHGWYAENKHQALSVEVFELISNEQLK
jgi:hypothetical protein